MSAASQQFVLFRSMVASLVLLIAAVGEISLANRINPIARSRGVIAHFPRLSLSRKLLRSHSQIKMGANEANIPEVLKPEGRGQSWQANNSDFQERPPPVRGKRGRFGHDSPVMNIADKEWQYFEAALSLLAPPNASELQLLRQMVNRLQNQIARALSKENYTAATILRDEVVLLQKKDPAVLGSSLRKSMQKAIKSERYDKASMYRDQLNILKRYQPEYKLIGSWQGKSLSRGIISARIRYDNDKLVATDVDGEMTFTADVSEARLPRGDPDVDCDLTKIYRHAARLAGASPKQDSVNFINRVDCFAADGSIAGQKVHGDMYLFRDDVIGFLFFGGAGGGGGGRVAMPGAREQPRSIWESDEDCDALVRESEIVSFKRVETFDESTSPSQASEGIKQILELERLFNLDSGDED